MLDLMEEGQQVVLSLSLLAEERPESGLAWLCCRCTPGHPGISVPGLLHGLPNGASTASVGRL